MGKTKRNLKNCLSKLILLEEAEENHFFKTEKNDVNNNKFLDVYDDVKKFEKNVFYKENHLFNIPLNIMIAAGGTGGHLFPAQALALEFIQKHPNIRMTFIGSGLKKNPYFKREHFSFLEVQSGSPFRKNLIQVLQALFKISKGFIQCLKFIGARKPDLIVGFGSYHTFPALYAAKLRKIPIVIFESNAVPGRVNRFCSKWAKVSAVQFVHASKYLKSKTVCVQMPLLKREEKISKNDARTYFGLKKDQLTFLIFGGSQGSQSINRFICEALESLIQKEIQFQIIHIVGDFNRLERLKEVYKKYRILASVKAFEENMEYAWAAADLNISRAGSATLAEIIEFTVPSILIPYPHGTENHQLKNAIFITEKIKGAITFEEKSLRSFILAEAIISLLENDHAALKKMKQALGKFKKEENKQDLYSVVLTAL